MSCSTVQGDVRGAECPLRLGPMPSVELAPQKFAALDIIRR
jgi:hypothetical protein